MRRIFQLLGTRWKACLVIFALLLLQAWCDLSLPGYTSDIVDVGIQMGGIESTVPDTVRADTLQALEWLMPQADAEQADAAFTPADENGLRTLTVTDKEERAALEDLFSTPDMVLYGMAAGQGEADAAGLDAAVQTVNGLPAQLQTAAGQMQAAAAAGMDPGAAMQSANLPENLLESLLTYDGSEEATRALVQGFLSQAMTQMDQETLDMMGSQAMMLVKLEYEAQGIAQKVQMHYLLFKGAQMLGMTLLLAACAICVGFLASRASAGIGRDLRQSVFKKVVSFSHAETDRFSTASLITRSTNDIQQIQMVCVIMLRMVFYAPILGIGGIIRVAHTGSSLSWIIALAVVALLCVMGVLVSIAMPKFKIMQKKVDQLNLVSREILTGIMPIRAFSREKFEEQRFDGVNKDLMQTQLFTNRAMAGMMPFMTVIMNGTTLLIVWFGAKAMDLGTMQVGDIIAFITYTMQIVMSFLMLTMVAIMLPRAGVAADRVFEVLETEPSIHDPDEATAARVKNHTWNGRVEFDHVSFRYPGGDTDALEDISFTAEPGQTTAIIGATGCGKSTLLNLIPRFFDATEGQVRIDGVDVREMPQAELRSLLGYVPQKGVLFSGTIDSNLKFGGPQITDETARKAAEIAQATEFIEAKPEGYQSPIAQGGTNVSGGQKQRLSIARAIAKNPKVYLFDDSFSALDFKTDVALRRALKKETGDATVIIVAQRISTVLHANQILVLDEGRIVGKGTHAQLMESCPTYQEIARSQLSQKELGLGGE
nr:ABC transporter ATP-binding protein [uncultured Gemmiger sp.]